MLLRTYSTQQNSNVPILQINERHATNQTVKGSTRSNCTVLSFLAGASRTVTDKLQRELNAAARVITGTRKFDRGLGQILHDQLHWLDVPDRILFKLAVTVHQCLNGRAPPYLSEHCILVSSADTRRHLRSTNRHLLAVPRFRLNTYGRRAFSVVGSTAWNSLPDFIRDPTSSTDCFRRLLKTHLFARH